MSWLVAVACSFAARGVHSVVLPWLLVREATASALTVGCIQGAALLAQALVLLALGGLGDRFGSRRIAVLGQLAAALPPLALCVAGESPTLATLLVYAVLSGVTWGVLCPARDALLGRSRELDLLRGATSFTLAQFAGLLGGIACASAAEPAGARLLFAAQAALHVAAALRTAFVARDGARRPSGGASAVRARAGAREPARAPFLRELVLLSALLGLCSAGPFAAWAPLLASAQSAQPAREIALLLALFPLGTIAGSLALRRVRARIDHRNMVYAAHLASSLCIACAGLASSFGAAVVLLAGWGLCGGVFLNCARALLLETTPRELHSRALARCQLALLASSPAGAVLGGLVAASLGVRGSLLVLGAGGLAGTLAAVIPSRAPRTIRGNAGAARCEER